MSLGYTRWNDPEEGFPRVSGDEPAFAALPRYAVGFSPREWG